MIDPAVLVQYLHATAQRGAEILKRVQGEDTDAMSDVCGLAWAAVVLEELTLTRIDLTTEQTETLREVLASIRADARDTARDYRAQFMPDARKDTGLN